MFNRTIGGRKEETLTFANANWIGHPMCTTGQAVSKVRRRSYGRDYGLGWRESELTLEEGSSKYPILESFQLL